MTEISKGAPAIAVGSGQAFSRLFKFNKDLLITACPNIGKMFKSSPGFISKDYLKNNYLITNEDWIMNLIGEQTLFRRVKKYLIKLKRSLFNMKEDFNEKLKKESDYFQGRMSYFSTSFTERLQNLQEEMMINLKLTNPIEHFEIHKSRIGQVGKINGVDKWLDTEKEVEEVMENKRKDAREKGYQYIVSRSNGTEIWGKR